MDDRETVISEEERIQLNDVLENTWLIDGGEIHQLH